MENAENKHKTKRLFFKKADVIIYLLLAAICLFAAITVPKLSKGNGMYLYIYSDGELETVLSMEINTVYTARFKENFNKIVIKDGCAFIEEADCPDEICINSGKISRIGESVICLPHRLKIQIKISKPQGGDI